MRFSTLFSLVAIAASAFAQSTTLYGQYDCTNAGEYTLCQNLWGENAGWGHQTTSLLSANGNSVSWSTEWNWQGGPNNVKSYANVIHNTAKGVQLASLASAPTAWNWWYEAQSGDIHADVSYDIWTGWAQTGNPASSDSSYEIMIWLSGKGGVQPVGSLIQSGIWLGGHNWNLWQGPNSNWQVLSFVSADGDITDFNADLKDFFNFLQWNHGVSQWQYIQAIQTGTEPFTGSATLHTNNFSVAVNQ
ncbi:concanavalin A-like lectin/glucanase domain-containing protein [Trametes polyzona]|nr:concanavalin A-like lectin/glucanase domain-containing protein [Trametes polyzona]